MTATTLECNCRPVLNDEGVDGGGGQVYYIHTFWYALPGAATRQIKWNQVQKPEPIYRKYHAGNVGRRIERGGGGGCAVVGSACS